MWFFRRRAHAPAKSSDTEVQIRQLVRSCELLVEALPRVQNAHPPPTRNANEAIRPAPPLARRVVQGAKTMMGDFQNVLSLLTIVGIAFYGIFIFGYSSYYSNLGVQLKEVGITYGAIILQAVFVTLIFAAVFMVLLTPVLVMLPTQKEHTWFTSSWFAVLMVYVGLIVLINSEFSVALGVGRILLVSSATLMLSVVYSVLSHPRVIRRWRRWRRRTEKPGARAQRLRKRRERRVKRTRRSRYFGFSPPLVMLLVVFTLLVGVPALSAEAARAGRREAKKLMASQESADRSLATAFLDIDVRKVAITWVGQRPGPKLPPRAAYLGGSEGVTVLFDTESCRAVRIPTVLIMLRDASDTALSPCPQGASVPSH
jgi:hypothetical protein